VSIINLSKNLSYLFFPLSYDASDITFHSSVPALKPKKLVIEEYALEIFDKELEKCLIL